MEKLTINGAGVYIFKNERLRELSDITTAAILAKRYAQSETERDRLERILRRAEAERSLLLGI